MKCVICRLNIIFSKTHVAQLMVLKINFCQRDIHSANSNFIPSQEVENGNGSLFLCDSRLRYPEKLQFMHTETRQIPNLRSQDFSKEILPDLMSWYVAKFKPMKPIFPVLLQIFDLECHGQTFLKVALKNLSWSQVLPLFHKIQKIKNPLLRKQKPSPP